MGIRAASPTPLELPLSNRTWFNMRIEENAGRKTLRADLYGFRDGGL